MRLTKIVIVMLLLQVLLAPWVWAKEAAPLAMDPELEKQVNSITSELRCLVCQNQTIADSHADLAIDLKNQVRGMVSKGKTKDQIVDYMVQRYGDFVRYRPPVKPTTYLLWGGPFILLVVGVFILVMNLRKRRTLAGVNDEELSAEESARLAALLGAKGEEGKL
jgi:cytochrome c-type biogenesis protein CcmH